MTLPDGSENPDYDPTDKRATIPASEEKWVAVDDQGKPTGAELHVRRRPDGEFDVIGQQNANPARPQTPSTNPQASNPSTRYEVRHDGPNGAPRLILVEERRDAQGNVVPTYEEVPSSQWPVSGTSEVVRNGRRVKVTHFGYGLPDREDDAGEDTSNRGTTTLKDDGQGGLVAITTYPDGRAPTSAPVPGVRGKPDQVTVGGQLYERQPDGTYKPAVGLPTGAEPPGASVPSGRLGEAAADLQAYQQWLSPQVQSGKLTPAQADKLLEARRAFWETAIKEQQGVTNAQSSIYGAQNQQRATSLTDLANRRGTAAQIAMGDPNGLTSLATKLGAGPGAATGLSEAIRNSRVDAANFVTLSGANAMVPEIALGPAMQSVNGMPLPYGTGAMPSLVRPNAIGLGAIGAVQAPGAAPPVPAPAPPVAASAAAPAPVPSRPPVTQPSVLPPNRPDQTQVGSQIDNAIAPPQAPPAPIFAPAQGVQAPSNAANLGQPGDPAMWPPGPQPPAQYGENGDTPVSLVNPNPYFLAGSSRGHVADPTPRIQALIADPDLDNRAVRQAVMELYPGYPIDALLGAT